MGFTFLQGALGFIGALLLVAAVCASLFVGGFILIRKYNKKGTKMLKELQPLQYVGIVLCILACLPFLHYFFMGFLVNAGSSAFDMLVGED